MPEVEREMLLAYMVEVDPEVPPDDLEVRERATENYGQTNTVWIGK